MAADDRNVLVVDRDAADATDLFRCLDAQTGAERWVARVLAPGKLDYGNSSRATPLVHDGRVYFLGAFGDLVCVELAGGRELWRTNLRTQFAAQDELVWGVASSPLVVDGRLIVNPGGPEASLVALEPKTGEPIWRTPGGPSAFASFVVARLGGRRQLVGFDKESLGGWDVESGRRLWRLVPQRAGEFLVPTPIVAGERLIVAGENNGTRLYEFDRQGAIRPRPVAENLDLAPDSHTPVLAAGRLFGVWQKLFCLSPGDGLKTVWEHQDPALFDYATILATDERLLVTTQSGELLLIDARADHYTELSRLKLFERDNGVYSHPALVGKRLFVRGSAQVVCLPLEE